PLEKLFARQIRVPLDSREAPALSVEDELVFVCVHGAKHLWERLLWIADVAALISGQPSLDWDRAGATAKELGAERMLVLGLQLAVSLLDSRLPETVLDRIRRDRSACHLATQIMNWLPAAGDRPPGLFGRAVFRLRMRGGWIAAPSYLLRLSLR